MVTGCMRMVMPRSRSRSMESRCWLLKSRSEIALVLSRKRSARVILRWATWASFARLVRRHGPMLHGVCRRVLHDAHDAEDVFQAAFLVLARKAGAGRWGESVGGWLHTTARRLALRARVLRERRRRREAQAA